MGEVVVVVVQQMQALAQVLGLVGEPRVVELQVEMVMAIVVSESSRVEVLIAVVVAESRE
jgi:hypothetical protein